MQKSQIKNNRKHGFGIQITNSTGDLYVGQFDQDKRQGLGMFKQYGLKAYISNFIQNQPDKIKHYGTFDQNDLTFVPDFKKFIPLSANKGKQIMCNVNEQILLKGNFIDKELYDLGEKIDKQNNITYTGKFQNSQLIQGVVEYKETGIKITGDFDEYGRLQDDCIIQYEIGGKIAKIKANFIDDEFAPQQLAKIQFIDGTQFKGYIENDQFKRQGELKTKDFTYLGNFNLNKFSGYGKIQYSNGDIYEGQFNKGRYEGAGKYTFKNGGIINDGNCQIIDTLGNIYNGQFLQNSPFDGSTYDGSTDNQLKRSGQGELQYPSVKYEGKFQENCLSGKILVTYQNNTQEYINYKGNQQIINQLFIKNGDSEQEIMNKILMDLFRDAETVQILSGSYDVDFQFTGKAKITFIDKSQLVGQFFKNKLVKQFKLAQKDHQMIFTLDNLNNITYLDEKVFKSQRFYQSFQYAGGAKIQNGIIQRTGQSSFSSDEISFNGIIRQNMFQNGKLNIMKQQKSETITYPLQYQGTFMNNRPHSGIFYLDNARTLQCVLENNMYKGKVIFKSGQNQLTGTYDRNIPQTDITINCDIGYCQIKYVGQAMDVLQDVAARLELIIKNKKFIYKGSVQNGGMEGVGRINGYIAIIKDQKLIVTDATAYQGLKGQTIQNDVNEEEEEEELEYQ